MYMALMGEHIGPNIKEKGIFLRSFRSCYLAEEYDELSYYTFMTPLELLDYYYCMPFFDSIS